MSFISNENKNKNKNENLPGKEISYEERLELVKKTEELLKTYHSNTFLNDIDKLYKKIKPPTKNLPPISSKNNPPQIVESAIPKKEKIKIKYESKLVNKYTDQKYINNIYASLELFDKKKI